MQTHGTDTKIKRNRNSSFWYNLAYNFLQIGYMFQFPYLRKLRIGESKDVYCDPDVSDPRFNTNIYPYIGYSDQMSWGFGGTGPTNLAMNILFTFSGGDTFFSMSYCHAFLHDFLLKNHRQTLVIKAERIKKWIDPRHTFLNSKRGGALV